jgi:hypothetical protein
VIFAAIYWAIFDFIEPRDYDLAVYVAGLGLIINAVQLGQLILITSKMHEIKIYKATFAVVICIMTLTILTTTVGVLGFMLESQPVTWNMLSKFG